jgi:hypothetical protein
LRIKEGIRFLYARKTNSEPETIYTHVFLANTWCNNWFYIEYVIDENIKAELNSKYWKRSRKLNVLMNNQIKKPDTQISFYPIYQETDIGFSNELVMSVSVTKVKCGFGRTWLKSIKGVINFSYEEL